jgi:hypothetical protein
MKTKLNFKNSMMAGFTAGIAAGAINAVLFYIFHSMGIFVDSIEVQPGQPLTVLPVLISSLIPSLIASIVFFLIEKYTNQGFRIFSIVSIILLLLSFANPFMGIKGITFNYGIALDLMHIVVVASLLFFINRSLKNNA